MYNLKLFLIDFYCWLRKLHFAVCHPHKAVASVCTQTHMTQHLWRSESSLNSALFFPGGRGRESVGIEREGGRGRRMTMWSGLWSIAPRWLKFPACQAWWIWLKIKESRGLRRADEWMNEWTLLQLYPLLHPKKKKHSPITLGGNSKTFLPRFRTKMFWCQAWLREVHSRNKHPPISQTPDSEKSPGRDRERQKGHKTPKSCRKTGDSSAFINEPPLHYMYKHKVYAGQTAA